MDKIMYGSRVRFQNMLGTVREVSNGGAIARVLFDTKKKTKLVPIDSLEKIDDGSIQL